MRIELRGRSRSSRSRCDGEPESRTGNGEAGRQTAAKRWWRGAAAAGARSGQGARRGLWRVDASLSLPSADCGLSATATPAPVSSVVFLFVLRSGQSQLCSRRFFRSFSFVFSFCSVHCRLQSAEAVAGRVESWSVSILGVIYRLQLALSVFVACVCPLRSWSPRLAVRGWSREAAVPAASAASSSVPSLPCSQRCLLACSQR